MSSIVDAKERPKNIGIVALEMYFPSRFVSQEAMEIADNCKGKYTVGLGQLQMAFADDREDINSIFLTAVHNLLHKYGVSPTEIGRVEVGTETLIDKSKSVKTTLMRLFGDNTDLEGITNVNACYGGTAAFFNSIAWVESSEWDGRYALVVCGDIAVYEAGPARPTGGCGAIAMLVGPNASLAIEPGLRSSHALDVYDFYKPHHSEYAAVDGKLSQWAYLSSVDTCYNRYKAKHAAAFPAAKAVTTGHFDFFAFHSPYNKLVQKGFARLSFMDFLQQPSDPGSPFSPFAGLPLEETYENKDLEAAAKLVAGPIFAEKVSPACKVNQRIGNCYTGSVFASLVSLIATYGDGLVEKRVMMFSYGSGSVASLYSLIGRDVTSGTDQRFSLGKIQLALDIWARLDARKQCTIEEFTAALDLRASKYGKAPMQPDGNIDNIGSGVYFLTDINQNHHRNYSRK